jgi:hypothetical protein
MIVVYPAAIGEKMGRLLKMCLNWKVLTVLAVAGLGIGLFAPGLFGRALPILLLAACPISMLVMMATMRQPTTPMPAPEDINSLQARLGELTAQQEQVKAHLARLASPSPEENRAESTR